MRHLSGPGAGWIPGKKVWTQHSGKSSAGVPSRINNGMWSPGLRQHPFLLHSIFRRRFGPENSPQTSPKTLRPPSILVVKKPHNFSMTLTACLCDGRVKQAVRSSHDQIPSRINPCLDDFVLSVMSRPPGRTSSKDVGLVEIHPRILDEHERGRGSSLAGNRERGIAAVALRIDFSSIQGPQPLILSLT